MKNNFTLVRKIEEGIRFIEEQDRKLQPVIDYLTSSIIDHPEDIPPEMKFKYLIEFMQLKTDSLLLLTKMKEILDYEE